MLQLLQAEHGRDSSGQAVPGEVECFQLGEAGQRRRDAPGQFVPAEIQSPQLGEGAQIRDGPGQVVVLEMKLLQFGQGAQIPDGPGEVVSPEVKVRQVGQRAHPRRHRPGGEVRVVADPEIRECVEGAQIGERPRQQVGRAEREPGDAGLAGVQTDRLPDIHAHLATPVQARIRRVLESQQGGAFGNQGGMRGFAYGGDPAEGSVAAHAGRRLGVGRAAVQAERQRQAEDLEHQMRDVDRLAGTGARATWGASSTINSEGGR